MSGYDHAGGAQTRRSPSRGDGGTSVAALRFANRYLACFQQEAAVAETYTTPQRLAAEFFGTFWLVLGGCGSAVLASSVANVGIEYLGVGLAFGLTVVTMAYAVGHISGGHFNPAVT